MRSRDRESIWILIVAWLIIGLCLMILGCGRPERAAGQTAVAVQGDRCWDHPSTGCLKAYREGVLFAHVPVDPKAVFQKEKCKCCGNEHD